MSPETLLLDKNEEEKTLAVARKSAEVTPEKLVSLEEDTTSPRDRRSPWQASRQSHVLAEEGADEEGRGGVQIFFDETPSVDGARVPLKGSLKALNELRSDLAGADWLEVAVALKQDVVRLRDTNYSRHAAVLLALADALTFTQPDEVQAGKGEGHLLNHALGLLSEPYISEASEEEFLGVLLGTGWNLAPSEEQAFELVD